MRNDYEWGTMTGEQHLCAIHKDENDDVFVLVGGVKIAKRGVRGTAHAATWITLQPGWLVRDVKGWERNRGEIRTRGMDALNTLN